MKSNVLQSAHGMQLSVIYTIQGKRQMEKYLIRSEIIYRFSFRVAFQHLKMVILIHKRMQTYLKSTTQLITEVFPCTVQGLETYYFQTAKQCLQCKNTFKHCLKVCLRSKRAVVSKLKSMTSSARRVRVRSGRRNLGPNLNSLLFYPTVTEPAVKSE